MNRSDAPRVLVSMDSVIFANNLHLLGLAVAGICLTACLAAILAMRDEH